MGYTLTGLATEEKVFILMGKSGNGKGTVMGLMQNLLGSYAVSVPPNLLTQAYSGNPNASSSALMRLRGARMILCTELKAEKFDEAFFKQLSGGDALAGRDNYAQQTEFMPVGKMWLSANDDPDISIEAEAMWRRILVLPFDASFAASMDTTLKTRLALERPGVLNLMIRAAKAYLNAREDVTKVDGQHVTGLRESVAVADATSALRLRSDSVLNWLTDCCKDSKSGVLQSSIAYKSYTRFSKANGKQPIGQRVFKRALSDKGYAWKKGNDFNGFVGLRLSETARS